MCTSIFECSSSICMCSMCSSVCVVCTASVPLYVCIILTQLACASLRHKILTPTPQLSTPQSAAHHHACILIGLFSFSLLFSDVTWFFTVTYTQQPDFLFLFFFWLTIEVFLKTLPDNHSCNNNILFSQFFCLISLTVCVWIPLLWLHQNFYLTNNTVQ